MFLYTNHKVSHRLLELSGGYPLLKLNAVSHNSWKCGIRKNPEVSKVSVGSASGNIFRTSTLEGPRGQKVIIKLKRIYNRVFHEIALNELYFGRQATIPDKKVGTASKFSPPPTYNVDNRVIFSLFVGKNAIFSNID